MIMRISHCFQLTRRSWRTMLLVLAVGVSGFVTAQAPVTRTEISTDVLLSLLGSGKAIEIELPPDVRAVHVVATQGDAVVIERTTEVGERSDGRSASVVLSVGGIGADPRCPLIVFIHATVSHARQLSGTSMRTTCINGDAPVALWPAPRPGLHEASFDVRTWYAIDGFWPAEVGPGAPRPTEDDVIVFHVYLATDDAAPPFDELGITDR
jgi:hypothetical protein